MYCSPNCPPNKPACCCLALNASSGEDSISRCLRCASDSAMPAACAKPAERKPAIVCAASSANGRVASLSIKADLEPPKAPLLIARSCALCCSKSCRLCISAKAGSITP